MGARDDSRDWYVTTTWLKKHVHSLKPSRLVRRFATDVVQPKVREMDEKEQMDPEIIKGLFDQGVRPDSIS